MRGSFLGPLSNRTSGRNSTRSARSTALQDDELIERVAELLAQEQVVGWFHGRMEFGPRSLGARSILADARSPRMQSVMNLKIKHRESFRPFAPSVLAEQVSDYFELDRPSPYMLLVAPVREQLRVAMSPEQEGLFGIDKLNVPRSTLPAVTHVDYSARVQTVHRGDQPAPACSAGAVPDAHRMRGAGQYFVQRAR